ncbi:MAG TPA: M23 family metallopeptidase [Thermoleophilaceae bacterium]|nr:M23 family metallopeptidase [Thermoleophilaceae bacterium]
MILCAAVAAPAGASAQDGSGGGSVYVATPKVSKVTCLRSCASKKRLRGGSVLVVTGTELAGVNQLTFNGSYGRGDDVTVKVRAGSDTRVQARVPLGAVTGPISLTTAAGGQSRPSKPVLILPPLPPEPNPELSPVPGPRLAGAPRLETGTSRTKAFVDARPGVKFSFRLSGASATSLKVELVSAADGTVVKTWTPQQVAPDVVQSISWNGRVGRAVARPGRYSFRLTAASADGATARNSQTGDVQRDAFDLYDHIFPVRGRHDFGGPGAHFGAGRAGHSHQGQDVMSRCGTRMVAARGGHVQFKGYHSAAGNYLVIDGDGTDVDYVYMHLDQPTPFRAGDRVYTGQTIGAVGDTGDAQGCHLHFEMWSGPGWYDGGDPFDPFPALGAWDSWS